MCVLRPLGRWSAQLLEKKAIEDVDGSRSDSGVIVLSAVDACRRARLASGTHGQDIARCRERDRPTEAITGVHVGCLEIGLLRPGGFVAPKHVGRPRFRSRISALLGARAIALEGSTH